MIALRIDERLIHGQVVVAWCNHYNVDSIIIANDQIVNDEITKMSLEMATPNRIKLAVRTIESAINLLNDPRIGSKRVLVLVTNPTDALALIESVSEIPYVNVGNYGMINSKDEKKIIATSFSVTDKDIEVFKKIIEIRPESNYQMTPTLNPQLLENLFKKL